MFDLFRSRDKAVRILLGAILLLVSLSMLTYLIPSYGSGGSDLSDMVVAEVAGTNVTLPEVQKVIQTYTRGGQIPREVLPSYIPQVVDGMVMQRALAYQAERLGFRVTDAQMSDAIRQMIPSLFPDGNFAGKEAYAAFLAQQNVSIEEFEEDLRRQLLIAQLRAVAAEGTIVTPKEIEQEYRRQNDKLKLAWVKLSMDDFRKQIQPTESEMREYFKANTANFQAPEKRNLTILVADSAKIEQSLAPSEADLQRAYNDRKEQFRVPERVRVRHILLKTTEKPASEEAKLKAQAEDLLKQIRAGGNFADLAKKYSEDPSSANNPKGAGELPDWITRGQTVPEFENVAFSLKPGETSGVIKTQYGYHILQVLAREEARVKPFEEVKAELTELLKKQRAADIIQNVADRVEPELRKNPLNPEKVASEFSMDVVKAEGFTAGSTVPEVGASPDFERVVSGLKQGEVSPVVGLQGGKIAIAVVTGVTPARPSTYEEVQDRIREGMTQNRAVTLLQQKVQQLTEAAKKSGDLAKSAKEMGFEVKISEEVNRSGDVQGLGSATAFSDAFGRAERSVLGPISVPNGMGVIQVLQHIPADMSALAQQREQLKQEIDSRQRRERVQLFDEGVREELTRRGKIKVNGPAITKLISSYSAG